MLANSTKLLGATLVILFTALATDSFADPPVEFAPNTDLDSNGAFEREYSSIAQTFQAPANGGQISFDWQVFSSEFFGGGAEDVFYARLIDTASGTILDEVTGALDPTPAGYMGTFTPIGSPPMGTTTSSEALASPNGLMFDAFHLDGGTGWMTDTLVIPRANADRPLTLEFLVADTVDRNADTSLAIDNIDPRLVTGAPILSLVNPSFETLMNGWLTEGNAGNYTILGDLFMAGQVVPGTVATDGRLFGLISTAGVPEPNTTVLWIIGCSALAGTGRRQRTK